MTNPKPIYGYKTIKDLICSTCGRFAEGKGEVAKDGGYFGVDNDTMIIRCLQCGKKQDSCPCKPIGKPGELRADQIDYRDPRRWAALRKQVGYEEDKPMPLFEEEK